MIVDPVDDGAFLMLGALGVAGNIILPSLVMAVSLQHDRASQ